MYAITPVCVICCVQYLSVRMCWGMKAFLCVGWEVECGLVCGNVRLWRPGRAPSQRGRATARRERKTTQSRLRDRVLLPGSAEVGTVSIIPGRTSADAYLRLTLWHCKRDVFSTSRMKGLRLSVYNWDWVEVWLFNNYFFCDFKNF